MCLITGQELELPELSFAELVIIHEVQTCRKCRSNGALDSEEAKAVNRDNTLLIDRHHLTRHSMHFMHWILEAPRASQRAYYLLCNKLIYHVTDAAEDTYYTVMTTVVSGN